MARKGRAVNRRRKPSGAGKKLAALLVVIAVAVAAFFLWHHLAPPAKPSPAKPAGPAHIPLPPRPEVQKRISSASLPAVVPEQAAVSVPKGPGRLSIIIDDMGASKQELQELLSIKLPLTFSVIPGLAQAKAVAEGAHAAGYQVMVHMPMEPEGYPKQRLEKVGLLLSMDNGEIAERVRSYFNGVPYAAGANNHMGSRFTQNAEKMEVVLKVLKEKGVFFVDSKTSPNSAGYRVAKGLGMVCGERQVFLDNVQDEGAIKKQLEQAVGIARKKGSAIAICHPHPTTIHALKSAMPIYAKAGITFVPASNIVKGER